MGNSSCFEGASARRPASLTLKYFPIAGRAEPVRLALAIGKLEYKDMRVTMRDWEGMKQSMPYHQLPVLEVDGTSIAQTKAILRYVGKLVKNSDGKYLYPKDPIHAVKVDELLDALDASWMLLAPTYRIQDQAQKEHVRRALFAAGAPGSHLVQSLEDQLSQGGGTPEMPLCVPPAGLTIADLAYFCYFCVIRSGFVEGLGPDLLDDYPAIMRHKAMVANIPCVKKYYEDIKHGDAPSYDVFKSEAIKSK